MGELVFNQFWPESQNLIEIGRITSLTDQKMLNWPFRF